jgi:hypothetical protein
VSQARTVRRAVIAAGVSAVAMLGATSVVPGARVMIDDPGAAISVYGCE